ncbi:MAG: hypothetical protein K2K80_06280 [Clostridia bacterium]|nr:hypothetical protein [Clostridia bacterium]
MKLYISVNSVADGTDYGGEQIIDAQKGEYRLDEIFRLPFFRIVIDEIIDGALCFRLMEGAEAHYFVLDKSERTAQFHRDTSLGADDFLFELYDD